MKVTAARNAGDVHAYHFDLIRIAEPLVNELMGMEDGKLRRDPTTGAVCGLYHHIAGRLIMQLITHSVQLEGELRSLKQSIRIEEES